MILWRQFSSKYSVQQIISGGRSILNLTYPVRPWKRVQKSINYRLAIHNKPIELTTREIGEKPFEKVPQHGSEASFDFKKTISNSYILIEGIQMIFCVPTMRWSNKTQRKNGSIKFDLQGDAIILSKLQDEATKWLNSKLLHISKGIQNIQCVRKISVVDPRVETDLFPDNVRGCHNIRGRSLLYYVSSTRK